MCQKLSKRFEGVGRISTLGSGCQWSMVKCKAARQGKAEGGEWMNDWISQHR